MTWPSRQAILSHKGQREEGIGLIHNRTDVDILYVAFSKTFRLSATVYVKPSSPFMSSLRSPPMRATGRPPLVKTKMIAISSSPG